MTLSARQLEVGYQRGSPAILQGLSVTIPAGRISALIGANGSGKTTLLKTLGRELIPRAGRVLLAGRDIAELSRLEMASQVSMLFQENLAPNGLTVEELVAQGRFPHRRMFEGPSRADEDAVERALQRTGLTGLRHRALDQLSGGQKQLAWIALALAQTTTCLLLDEPTTFLDLKHQIEVMDVIEALRDELKLTIVMVLHDVNQAARHADHLIAMRAGKIVAEGAPAHVISKELLRAVYDIDAEVLLASDGLPVCFAKSATRKKAGAAG